MHILTRKFGVLSQKVRMLFLCYPYTVFPRSLQGRWTAAPGSQKMISVLPFRLTDTRFFVF